MSRFSSPSRRLYGVQALWCRMRYSIQLLLDRRLGLFLVADAMLLFFALLTVLGEGGRAKELFIHGVVLPVIIVGLPALSSVLALERRAGSLDLALAVPSTEGYFLRRVIPVCAVLTLQGWLFLGFNLEHPGDLLRSMAQSLLVTTFLGIVVLFWAVRLPTAGAVLVASAVSLALASKWLFYDPSLDRSGGMGEQLFGLPVPLLSWWANTSVLVLAIMIIFAYTRLRLRRPETLLT